MTNACNRCFQAFEKSCRRICVMILAVPV
jgi:hypothetical protein